MTTASLNRLVLPTDRFVAAKDLSPVFYRMLTTAVLLLMFFLALSSMVQKAPTYDEQGFILRGLAYLRGHTQIRVGHPLGLNALNASLLVTDEQVALPLNDPSWAGTSFHRPSELFLWEIGNNVEHIMFLARLPTLWLALLLSALAARWAGLLSGRRWAALLALLFVALDPNILASGRLATTDLGLTTFSLLAAYTLWSFLKNPSWVRVILAGAALGLLQNTKFTALLFLPLFALVIGVWLVQSWRQNYRKTSTGLLNTLPWPSLAMIVVAYPLTAVFVLWAANGFDIGTLPASLPTMQFLGGMTLPLANHLEQLLDIGGRMQASTPSFLLGQYSDSGWWYYFPAAFLLKTPLPTLILIGWGLLVYLLCLLRREMACPSLLDSAALLIPCLGYFAIALTTDINLGYRHILPTLTFMIVFSVTAVASNIRHHGIRLRTVVRIMPIFLLSAWLVLVNLLIYPDYLSYFNFLAGGADRGWRSLVDSNLDWGQDIDDLAPWMAENGVDKVWLSYFGEARPEYYGINYSGLDSFPPRLMNPQARTFYGANPAPGVYAISATNLQGVHFANHDQFAWFRDQEPIGKLGYSIFLYEVPPIGERVDLVLAGTQVDQLPPAIYDQLGTNDVRLHWVDPQESLIIPDGDEKWLVREIGHEFHPLLQNYLEGAIKKISRYNGFELVSFDARPSQNNGLARFSSVIGKVFLKHAEVVEIDRSNLVLLTTWQQGDSPVPLQFFVHALDEDGRIVAQWDGLGAAWEGWLKGDNLIHVHELSLAEDATIRTVDVRIGIYDPTTGKRWLTETGNDSINLAIYYHENVDQET